MSKADYRLENFFKSEFEKDLEKQGVDTVCFMGYGYSFDDVKVGAEFYFSYLYYFRSASLRDEIYGHTVESVLDNCLKFWRNTNFFDRYVILRKYKYFDCFFLDRVTRTAIPMKERREFVKIKNLRTGEISVMKEDDIFYFNRLCFVIW
jgi:hypothetical protein